MAKTSLNLYFLLGPTAAGKSDVAIPLALSLDAEIISLDSMAIYRGMNVGTAKPSPEDRSQIPHHLIDIVNPWEPYTVAQYIEDAEKAILDIRSRGRAALFVGGTGLYLKCFREGLFDGPGASPAVREHLQRRAAAEGAPSLHAELARLDPATASRLHPNDARRVIRALEVCTAAGRPMSEMQAEYRAEFEDARRRRLGADEISHKMVALRRERTELDAKIEARTKLMFERGLVEETRRLAEECAEYMPCPEDLPQSWRRYLGRQASRALGYFEALRHINGEITLHECKALVYTHTRQFSTKQMTWFRSFAEAQWLDLKGDASEAAAQATAMLRP